MVVFALLRIIFFSMNTASVGINCYCNPRCRHYPLPIYKAALDAERSIDLDRDEHAGSRHLLRVEGQRSLDQRADLDIDGSNALMHLVRHIRVVGPFRFDLLGLGLQFSEPRLLLWSARDWHADNIATAVGNTPGQAEGGRDPLPALGADLLAFDLQFFGDRKSTRR